MEVNYSITDSITPEEYMKLRAAVGWGLFPLEEAKAGLSNSYIWCLRDNEASGKPIGIGRVIMEQVMDFIHEQLKPGYKFMVSLCSAKGKEEFYKKFGFVVRPNDDVGPGMHQWFGNE